MQEKTPAELAGLRHIELTVSEQDGRATYVVERVEPPRGRIVYRIVKRATDICAALVGIVLLAIPMLFIGLWIRRDSVGPIIYRQERLGQGGKPFMLYKFRSMKNDAEDNGAQWAEVNDERVTRVGAILRKTRMDELPQLFNILLGDMSLVGPRPERQIFYDQFEQYIDGFHQRLLVPQGLTGWAQVNGGYDLMPEQKIIFDLEYIKNRSVKLDLVCLMRTAGVVVTHDGAH